jgi:Zn2+/Cd2+-exporting ATPase
VCEIHEESTFLVEGLCCQQEATLLERHVTGVPGVERISADVVARRIRVSYDAAVTSTAAIAEAVAEIGMRAWVDQGTSSPRQSAWWQERLVLVSALALAAGAGARLLGWAEPWSIPLMALAVVTGGITTLRRALYAVRHRRLDIYVLMLVAVTGAALIGEWFEAATVVVLFSLAQALERRSLDRARHAIRTLVSAGPDTVRVKRGTEEVMLPVSAVRVGDTMLVSPGERIALDGTVAAGATEVNQAPVTGESMPVGKSVGDRVFAGTINGRGSVDVSVTAVGEDTTLARIIHLVERAQAQRAPSQAWVDRFAQRYTPIVLLIAGLVAIVPPLLLAQPFSPWIYRSLVLLVIACPCALVLSTPISVVSALAAAARRGVLIKGGVHLERLADIRAVALDKTGTLTRGALTVADVRAFDGVPPEEVLRLAAAAGARSQHPLDRAVVGRARSAGLTVPPVTAMRALPGQGVEAIVEGDAVFVGSASSIEARGLLSGTTGAAVAEAQSRGMAVIVVVRSGVPLGLIGLSDELRVHGREAVEALRQSGIDHVALLTGDHERSAREAGVAGRVDAVASGLMPDEKVATIARLKAEYGPVAMVGDGINDAPALAAADVGIAMGGAGTAAAIETADVTLMADDLRGVPFAVRLGRATVSTIRANVAVALGLKLAFLALAVAGVATLWMAVVADMGASILVVTNALRLLRFGRLEPSSLG